MIFRHAAALALIGWYLVFPPLRESSLGGKCYDANAPLSAWRIMGSFDTAKECKNGLQKEEDDKIDRAAATGEHVEANCHGISAWLDVICVATDDPRLKEK